MRTLFILIFVIFGPAATHAQTQVERDFDTFVRWFSGSWDNEIQTFNENYERIPDEDRHNRIHMVYRPVRAEAFPGVLFVIENYSEEGVRGPLNYISVHHFFVHAERNAIAHEFLFRKEGDWAYLEGNAEAAADLTPDDVRWNAECVMYWHREAGQFVGTTDPGACRVGEDRNELDAKGLLSRTDLWRRDLVLADDGSVLRGHEEFEKFRKARYYSCYGRHQDSDGEWVYFQDQRVHNQGDLLWLGDKNLGVQIRQIIWTTGSFSNATALQAFQNGNERATVNAHGSLNTNYIGLDHPEFVVNCDGRGRFGRRR